MGDVIFSLVQRRLIRFILIGAMNTAFSYGLYALFLSLGLSFQLGNLFALIIGIIFSFVTQGAFVFGNREKRLIGRFALVWIVIYFFNIVLIGQFLKIGLDAYSSGALAIIPCTLLSYLFQKFYVFRLAAKSA